MIHEPRGAGSGQSTRLLSPSEDTEQPDPPLTQCQLPTASGTWTASTRNGTAGPDGPLHAASHTARRRVSGILKHNDIPTLRHSVSTYLTFRCSHSMSDLCISMKLACDASLVDFLHFNKIIHRRIRPLQVVILTRLHEYSSC